jgi:hypothetical protein
VGGFPAALNVTIDSVTGAVSMVCAASIVTTNATYSCGGTCWGQFTGAGLLPGATYHVFSGGTELGSNKVSAGGTIAGISGLRCGFGSGGLQVTSTTAAGAPISSNIVLSPCG